MRQALELRPVRSLIETALRRVGERTSIPFAVRFAEGGEHRTSDQPPAFTLVFRDARAYWRIAAFGHIGLLEAYFDGELDIEGNLAEAMAAGMEGGMDRPKLLVRVRNWWHELRLSNASWRQARTNADFHYALGPEFYRLWLDDPLMMYTCAYWKEGTRTLEEAQRNKIDHVARKLLLAPGEEVVDIGAGFGGFMFHAHERFGVRVTGVNTTASQADMVRGEIERRRLGGTLQVLSDFRDARREYDKVVSIGTLEHAKRFDERFRRIWRVYLYGCAEMFRSPKGHTHLFQVVFSKGNVTQASYPMSRGFLYEQPAYHEKRSLSSAA